MTPSATKAIALGVTKLREELTEERGPTDRRLRFFRFQTTVDGRRHELDVKWHTRAGAWEAALRWAKRLQQGSL